MQTIMKIIKATLLFFAGFFFFFSWNIIDHVPPWNAFYSEALAVAALILALVFFIIQGKRLALSKYHLIFLAIFIVQGILQYATQKIYFNSTYLLYFYYLLIVYLSLELGRFIQEVGAQKKILYLVLITALGSAFFALVDWIGLGRTGIFQFLIASSEMTFRARGNIMQPNHLAVMCCIGLVATVILLKDKKITAPLYLFLIFLSFITGITASRAGLLILLCLVPIAYCLFEKEFNKKAAGLFLLAFVLCSATMYAAPFIYEGLLLGDASGGSLADRGVDSPRKIMWYQALLAVIERPWFGYGWRQVAASQLQVAHLYPGREATIYYHNIVIDALIENGIIFCLIGLLFLFFVLRKLEFRKNIFWILIPAPIFLQSFLEFPFSYTYFIVVFFVFFRISYTNERVSKNDYNGMFSYGLTFGVIAFSVLLWLDYQKCETMYVSTRLQYNGIAPSGNIVKAPKVFVLDDLAKLSALSTYDKTDYTQKDLLELQYLTARFPSGHLNYYYIKALAYFKQYNQAQTRYLAVLSSAEKTRVDFINYKIERDPALAFIERREKAIQQ